MNKSGQKQSNNFLKLIPGKDAFWLNFWQFFSQARFMAFTEKLFKNSSFVGTCLSRWGGLNSYPLLSQRHLSYSNSPILTPTRLSKYYVPQEPFFQAQCSQSDCYSTSDRSLLAVDQFDVILFHQRSLSRSDLPEKRQQI